MTSPIRVAHLTTVDLTLRFLLLGQLRRLRDEGYDVVGISAPGPWTGELEDEGIRHIAWTHATRSWDPFSDALAFAEIVGILRRERFHIVHTHNPKPGVMGRIAARLVGVPCVFNTVHGLYATPADGAAKRLPVLALERLAARFSDLELYQSEEDLQWARRIGVVDRAKSVLLGNGTDLSRFDPAAVANERLAELREELGIQREAPVVGTVGRLVREKGYGEFFAAARKVRAKHPGVRFIAVGGPDPDKGDAIPAAELERAAGDVIVTGWRDDVRDLLALMDVFVLPSWREGMPRSAIEAAAMGKPLVLTDIRGCREVARDGVEGILVPPGNADRLAEAIVRLLADPPLRARLGSSARTRAISRFDEARVAETVVKTYRDLLERKGMRPRAFDGFRIRRARVLDAPALARLHRDGLPDAFLPTLGERFLAQLYRAMARDREAVALVAENGDGVIGFATAVPGVRAFYRRFYVRYAFPAALAAATRLVRPSVLRRARESAGYPDGMEGLPESELLSIVVAASARARGVGRALVAGVLEGLGTRGVESVRVVVGADNEGANRFYTRMGFRRARRIVLHEGRVSNVWVRPCRS